MNTTKLYLIRHGETEQNKTGVLMGSTDTPLNEQGRLQALSLRERINALEVDAIFSSPLSRAVETALLVFGQQARIVTDTSLQEALATINTLASRGDELKALVAKFRL